MHIVKLWQNLMSSDFSDKLERDRLLDLAAALSYYAILSLAPLLVIVLWGLSLIDESLKSQWLIQAQDLVGENAGAFLESLAEQTNSPSIANTAGFLGLLTLLFSASAIFGQLRSSLNLIFEVPAAPEPSINSVVYAVWDFLKRKIISMGMVLAFVGISAASLFSSAVLTYILDETLPLKLKWFNFVVTFSLYTVLFGLIYWWIPQKKVGFKISLTAGVISTLAFMLSQSLIGLYFTHSAVVSMYGAAGSLIVLLMWVYFSALIVFASAEIANEIYKIRRP